MPDNAGMQFLASIIKVDGTTLAAILVTPGQTHPEPGARLVDAAHRVFPTLPIFLISPRIRGFSHSFAHFDLSSIIRKINVDEIAWHVATSQARTTPLPF